MGISGKVCISCGAELSTENQNPAHIVSSYNICRACYNKRCNNVYHNTPSNRKSKRIFSIVVERTTIAQYIQCTTLNDHIRVMNDIIYHEYKTTPTDNKKSSTYLGVNVAETVLSKIFKDVEQMPYGNHGYDFICNKGMKIDSKASIIHNEPRSFDRWRFQTKKNTVADYFIFLAFDNREDLNPLHIWMMPTKKFKDANSASISTTTINKWDKYRLHIDKVINCCNTFR